MDQLVITTIDHIGGRWRKERELRYRSQAPFQRFRDWDMKCNEIFTTVILKFQSEKW
jgi:hypothetical protein